MAEAPTFIIEDAKLIFKNFEGKEKEFNRKGDRNFNVVLPEDVAQQMLADGWNVKWLKPREDEDEEVQERTAVIAVTVNFENRPPRIVMITSTARTNLNQESVEVLDWANMKTVDLICRGNVWSVNGKSGIKAYLQSMFVTIEEDALERKYAMKGGGDD